jgi:hypothetical protein
MSVSLDMAIAPRFDRGITVVRIFNGQQGARTPIISAHTLCLDQLQQFGLQADAQDDWCRGVMSQSPPSSRLKPVARIGKF